MIESDLLYICQIGEKANSNIAKFVVIQLEYFQILNFRKLLTSLIANLVFTEIEMSEAEQIGYRPCAFCIDPESYVNKCFYSVELVW